MHVRWLAVLLLAVAVTAWAAPQTLSHRDVSAPRWAHYDGAGPALVFLQVYDSVHAARLEGLQATGYDGATDYGARAVAIPKIQPTVLVDGYGKLRSFWNVGEPLRIAPGRHRFEVQSYVKAEPTIAYDPDAPDGLYSKIEPLKETLEADTVYCLAAHRRGDGKTATVLLKLGTVEFVRGLPESGWTTEGWGTSNPEVVEHILFPALRNGRRYLSP